MVDVFDTLAPDFWVIDGLEPVTLRVRTGEAAFDVFPGCQAYREIDKSILDTGGGALLRQVMTVWRIPQLPLNTAGAPMPKVGDELEQEDGTRWYLETSDLDEFAVETVCQGSRRLITATG